MYQVWYCLTAPFRARDLCTRLVAENQCLWWVLPRVNTVRSQSWRWPQLCRILRVILKFRNCLFPQSAPWLGCWFPCSNSWSAAAWSSLSPSCWVWRHNELPPGDCVDCEIVLDRGPGVISVTTYTWQVEVLSILSSASITYNFITCVSVCFDVSGVAPHKVFQNDKGVSI